MSDYTFEDVDEQVGKVADALANESGPLIAAIALGIIHTEKGYECAGHPRLRKSGGDAAARALVYALRNMADMIEQRFDGCLQ